MSKWMMLAMVVAFVWLGGVGCGGIERIPTSAMPPGVEYSGLWYSNYGDMELVQTGEQVKGTFTYRSGGTLMGTLEGGVLRFDWVQEGDLSVGRREVSGKGYFVMSSDGQKLEGKWGYGYKFSGGGVWTADRAKVRY